MSFPFKLPQKRHKNSNMGKKQSKDLVKSFIISKFAENMVV